MITCSRCRNLTVSLLVEAKGHRIHTKLNGNKIIISPEHYVITERIKDQDLKCECGKLDLVIDCDSCGKVMEDKINVYNSLGRSRQLALCNDCVSGIDEDKYEEVSIEDMKIDFSRI